MKVTNFISTKPNQDVLSASKYEGNKSRAKGKNGIAIMKLNNAGKAIS